MLFLWPVFCSTFHASRQVKFQYVKLSLSRGRSYCINFDRLIYSWTLNWKLSFLAHESNYHTGKPIFPCKICGRNFGVSQALNSMSLIIFLLAILSKSNLHKYIEIKVTIALLRFNFGVLLHISYRAHGNSQRKTNLEMSSSWMRRYSQDRKGPQRAYRWCSWWRKEV